MPNTTSADADERERPEGYESVSCFTCFAHSTLSFVLILESVRMRPRPRISRLAPASAVLPSGPVFARRAPCFLGLLSL